MFNLRLWLQFTKYLLVKLKVKVHSIFDTEFYELLNTIGVIYDRSCGYKVLFYVANTFLWFEPVFVFYIPWF